MTDFPRASVLRRIVKHGRGGFRTVEAAEAGYLRPAPDPARWLPCGYCRRYFKDSGVGRFWHSLWCWHSDYSPFEGHGW